MRASRRRHAANTRATGVDFLSQVVAEGSSATSIGSEAYPCRENSRSSPYLSATDEDDTDIVHRGGEVIGSEGETDLDASNAGLGAEVDDAVWSGANDG